ncbi:START domain-containing protein [Cinnamomum micranthum f. kanehirae]|uniref:START domain-containing protein n=1 Tax=Cinnamomum micranthum f. kanehirae TaxID=337451 RepID=A0A3S3MZY7_9MAGN|nr:START domain-containing protein [Cinnamomum micranthum f. kanehirae]
MALVWKVLLEILQRPTVGDVVVELMLFLGPVWIAVLVGLVVGWAWKPRWANLGREKSDLKVSRSSEMVEREVVASGSESEGLVLPSLGFNFMPRLDSIKAQLPQNFIAWVSEDRVKKEEFEIETAPANSDCSAPRVENEQLAVTTEDLEHLCQLVEVTDGGPTWLQMMDRTSPTMCYQAWRRDPEIGPPQYRSRTVFEDATPELVRDFFWDDEFRIQSKWDDMLIHSETLEECPTTGTMVVHWIRKFPFFCSNREYTIGRRIWESGRTYYCVTKGVPCSSVPRRNKPRRVDLYYSSWCIRAVESSNGQLTSCEVLLFHHEDMGISWEIAKLGVRQGMWGAVKKIEPGLRAYQAARRSGVPLSRCAYMAQINTKVNPDYLRSLETTNGSSEIETLNSKEKPLGKNIPKFLIIGGAVALACSLDRGLLTKAVIFGIARRFAKVGRRL